jgi:hypothetical protein
MQLAALRGESEDAYQKLLATQSTPTPKIRHPVRPAPRAAEAKAPAKEPIKMPGPTRRVTKRTTRPAADAAAAEVTPSDPGGTPAWRRKAGLPINSW